MIKEHTYTKFVKLINNKLRSVPWHQELQLSCADLSQLKSDSDTDTPKFLHLYIYIYHLFQLSLPQHCWWMQWRMSYISSKIIGYYNCKDLIINWYYYKILKPHKVIWQSWKLQLVLLTFTLGLWLKLTSYNRLSWVGTFPPLWLMTETGPISVTVSLKKLKTTDWD